MPEALRAAGGRSASALRRLGSQIGKDVIVAVTTSAEPQPRAGDDSPPRVHDAAAPVQAATGQAATGQDAPGSQAAGQVWSMQAARPQLLRALN